MQSIIFILDIYGIESLTGINLKLKTSFWGKHTYVQESALNFNSAKTKFQSHINIWEKIKSQEKTLKNKFQYFINYWT